jgi:EmrB/QacA subfamily drug resistance transporter
VLPTHDHRGRHGDERGAARLQESLHFSATSLSWVLNAYALAFGGLLLLGGRAGDILGRRRVFVAGVLLFTVASLLGGLATSAAWLLAARALQGVAAAFAAPSTLALIATNFKDGAERNRALGVFSTVAGLGLAVGLILGGILTELASWRWVLLINVPIGLVVALLAPRVIDETPRHPGRFDLSGALTSTLGLVLVVFGLVQVASTGWDGGGTIGSFAVGLLLLAVFLGLEARAEQPIMPLSLFTSRTRAAAYLNMLLLVAAMFSMFFFVIQFLQKVLHLTPLQAGIAFLPMALTLFVASRLAPVLFPKLGARTLMIAGATMITLGLGWLTQVSTSAGYAEVILGPLFLVGAGAGFSFMPLNLTILAGLPPRDAGAASGLLQTMQQIGGALGLAILITVFGTTIRDTGHAPAALSATDQAQWLMVLGMQRAFLVGAAFSALALVVALVAVRTTPRPPKRRAQTGPG